MHCGRSGGRLLGLLLAGSAQATRPEPAVETVNGSEVKCPTCGWGIASDFSWCPNCGTRTRPQICSYCRSLVPVGEADCPHCGAPLE